MKLGEPMSDEEMMRLLDKQGALQDQIDASDGWNLQSTLDIAMDALRLPPSDADPKSLSGGEKRRVALCRLLLEKPDLLLLDEPTNHLDAESVAWLQGYLQKYPGCVILVTHDRYFLDEIVDWILELDRGEAHPFQGNYSQWLEAKEARLALEEKKDSARKRKITHELEWVRSSPKARQAKSKARITAFESLVADAAKARRDPNEIRIPPGPRLGTQVIEVEGVTKAYGDKLLFEDLSFRVTRGAIVGIVGPNGAGKTTLISIICGIVKPSEGAVTVDGHDIIRDYRAARAMIGLVPQELTTDAFETVWATVSFSRGLFGKPKDPAHIEKVLKDLSLWDKRDDKIMTLSGGMKRRVLIAKALSHEPNVLFLDEPTAGVDVELRKDMWQVVRDLRAAGVTIILTTHYIEEAEEMADRVGVINNGEIVLVEEKAELMRKLGKKQLTLHLHNRLDAVPDDLAVHHLALARGGSELVYTYDTQGERTGITALLGDLNRAGIRFRDLHTTQSSLEDIFVGLVGQRNGTRQDK